MAISPSSLTDVLQHRRTVDVFDRYAGAQRAVDILSDRGFPVQRVAIVGTGLRYVEQVSSRMTTVRAAMSGAAQGAVIGLLFAFVFGVFFTIEEAFLGVLIYSVVLGLLFGAIIRALDHAAHGDRRDFASTAQMQADRYEVQVDSEVADRAIAILRETEVRREAAA